jgi:predicted  nucleic acid-binding Zn-ribbon protein
MSEQEKQFHEAMSDLANALQTAAPLATQLRRELSNQAQDALTLEAEVDRAVRAARQFRPGDDEKGGAS